MGDKFSTTELFGVNEEFLEKVGDDVWRLAEESGNSLVVYRRLLRERGILDVPALREAACVGYAIGKIQAIIEMKEWMSVEMKEWIKEVMDRVIESDAVD